MEKWTGERQARGVGRTATVAAAAGLSGLAVTVALTASVLIGAVYGATSSSPVAGPEDDRPDGAARAGGDASAAGWIDDYGIRCLVVGWCNMPPGMPRPYVSSATDESAALAGGEATPAGSLDDYGIRCLAVGWCAMPPGQPQPSRSSTTE